MPELPDVAAFKLAPDWIGEVLSPSTQALDCTEKIFRYARSQVTFVWVLDPLAQILEAYRLEGILYLLVGTWHGNATVGIEPFEVYPARTRRVVGDVSAGVKYGLFFGRCGAKTCVIGWATLCRRLQ
jgi:hypothetical protein